MMKTMFTKAMALVLTMMMVAFIAPASAITAAAETSKRDYDKAYKLSKMTLEDVKALEGQTIVHYRFKDQEIYLLDSKTGLRTRIEYSNDDMRDLPMSQVATRILFIDKESYSASIAFSKKGRAYVTFLYSPTGYEVKYYNSSNHFELPDFKSGNWTLSNCCGPMKEVSFINMKEMTEIVVQFDIKNSIKFAPLSGLVEVFRGETLTEEVVIYRSANGAYYYDIQSFDEK